MNEYSMWCFKPLRKYADFFGRSRRKEYWHFVMFLSLMFILLAIFDFQVGIVIVELKGFNIGIRDLFSIVMLIPNLAVSVRRLHDVGKSGWWLLISMIPLFGGMILFIWNVKDGEPGINAYGINPKSTG